MFIYVLKDPTIDTDLAIRYVGKTERSIEQRYNEHIRDATSKNADRHTSYVHKWLRKLIRSNLMPIVEIVDISFDKNDLNQKERYYVKYFKDLGCRLTNLTEGGEGQTGLHLPKSRAHRMKLSRARGGKPFWDQYGRYYACMVDCAEELKISRGSISEVLRGDFESVCGWRFSYEKPTNPEMGPAPAPILRSSKEHARLRAEMAGGGSIVDNNGNVYPSVRNAAVSLGINMSGILKTLKGKQGHTNGYTFALVTPAPPEKRHGGGVAKKAVVDQNGKIYPSISEAGRDLNISPNGISGVLRGELQQIKGFVFAYAESGMLPTLKPVIKKGTPIVDQNGTSYPSLAEAARIIGGSKTAISRVVRGKIKSHHGYIFRYIDDNLPSPEQQSFQVESTKKTTGA